MMMRMMSDDEDYGILERRVGKGMVMGGAADGDDECDDADACVAALFKALRRRSEAADAPDAPAQAAAGRRLR
eukprot:3478604-Pyramimonas_sp.AAC.1